MNEPVTSKEFDLQLTRGNVFSKPGTWYRGAMHLHTTASDGKLSPDEALAFYKSQGYDFICFGDHWYVTVPRDPENKILVIPGCEIDTWENSTLGNTHVMCVGVDPARGQFRPTTRMGVSELWDFANSISDYCWIAHPWWSTQSPESLKSFPGLRAIEVYNNLFETSLAIGDGEYPWHMMLNEGQKIDAIAVDDAHGGPESCAQGWVMVRAAECTQASIIAALKAGDFYSTRGPKIESVEFTGTQMLVRTSPAKRIAVRSSQFFGKLVQEIPGQSVTEIRLNLNLNDMDHVRVMVEDHEGKRAWSNPFYFGATRLKPKHRIEPAQVAGRQAQTWSGE